MYEFAGSTFLRYTTILSEKPVQSFQQNYYYNRNNLIFKTCSEQTNYNLDHIKKKPPNSQRELEVS